VVNVDLGADHAGTRHTIERPVHMHAERIDGALDDLARHARVEGRAHEHVTRDSRRAIDMQVQPFHGCFRFISAAAKPAPNPLSMFTTVTPDAQELSIASSAAMPPKLAP